MNAPVIKPVLDRPLGLWSLWDIMQTFHDLFVELKGLLEIQQVMSLGRYKQGKEHLGLKPPSVLDQQQRQHLLSVLVDFEREFSFMEWSSVQDRIQIIKGKINPGIDASELHIEIEGLNQTIEMELSRRWFQYVPKERAVLWRMINDDWWRPLKSFPFLKDEIAASLSCYATDNHTACVFHMMRVAEIGLRALARERKIKLPRDKPLEWGTWQDIIKGIRDEVKIIALKKAGAPKDNALSFYNGCLDNIDSFKDEYRNQVMHVRKMYDKHQALRTIERVRDFMVRVSERIDQRHFRIRWGLK